MEYLLYTLHYLEIKHSHIVVLERITLIIMNHTLELLLKQKPKTIIKEYLRNILDEASRIFTACLNNFKQN